MSIPLRVQAAHSIFLAAEEAYNGFCEENGSIIEERAHLVDAYNDARETMRGVCKDMAEEIPGSNVGRFKLSRRHDLSVPALMKCLGDEAKHFIKTKESVDRKAWTSAVQSGDMPSDVIDEVESTKIVVLGPPAIDGDL